MRDEIEALLGSVTVQRAIHAPPIGYADEQATASFDDSISERDTEPSADVRLLREAVRAASK